MASASNGESRTGKEHLGIEFVIDHGDNKDGLRINTQYKHLQTQLVRVGDTVMRGQQIGTLGRTGVL